MCLQVADKDATLKALVRSRGMSVPLAGVCRQLEKWMGPDTEGRQRGVFDAQNAPPIGMTEYLTWWASNLDCSEEVYIIALVYILRLRVPLNPNTVHRVLLACLVVAIKWRDDVYYANSAYAEVGGTTRDELTRLETAVVTLTDWNLHVSEHEYAEVLATCHENERETAPPGEFAPAKSVQFLTIPVHRASPSEPLGVLLAASGTRISGVVPRSLAAKAGVSRGMVVCAVQGVPVASRDAFVQAVRAAGTTVVLQVQVDAGPAAPVESLAAAAPDFLAQAFASNAAAAAQMQQTLLWASEPVQAAATPACRSVGGAPSSGPSSNASSGVIKPAKACFAAQHLQQQVQAQLQMMQQLQQQQQQLVGVQQVRQKVRAMQPLVLPILPPAASWCSQEGSAGSSELLSCVDSARSSTMSATPVIPVPCLPRVNCHRHHSGGSSSSSCSSSSGHLNSNHHHQQQQQQQQQQQPLYPQPNLFYQPFFALPAGAAFAN